MKAGDKVQIFGRKRTLVRSMPNIAGGWEVNKPVEGFRYWNADTMKVWHPVSKGLAELEKTACNTTALVE